MNQTAIVIFAFNRPDHLQKTLEHLSRAEGVERLPICFYIDGPRNSNEAGRVNEVRVLAENFSHPNKSIVINETNKGLRPSVIEGLKRIFDQYTRAIVLEDDICVHPTFLNYHLQCLDTYQNRQDIWSISAYVIPAIGKQLYNNTKEELMLASRASSWGWSTWKDRWSQAVWDKETILKQLQSNYLLYSQTGGDKLRMLLREMNGKSSSWAIIWDYNHFMHRAYCVYPYISLVANIGLDNSGTHSKASAFYSVDLNNYQIITQFKPDIKPNALVSKIFGKLNYKFYRNPFEFIQVLYLFLRGRK